MGKRGRLLRREPSATTALVDHIGAIALPLRDPDDLDPLFERIGDARFVLLGEASHGTADYYNWRTSISRRVIADKGFSFITVEGEWPDCYRVNHYVCCFDDAGTSAREVLHACERWPTLHEVQPKGEAEVPDTYPSGV